MVNEVKNKQEKTKIVVVQKIEAEAETVSPPFAAAKKDINQKPENTAVETVMTQKMTNEYFEPHASISKTKSYSVY